MKLKDALFAVTALSLIGGLALLWLAPEHPARAPDIALTTLQGERLSIPELRGKPVLVSFWASTCPRCLDEIPHLIELYEELAPRGFEIIAIAMAYDPPNRVVTLSQAKQIPYPIALDIQGDAARAFGNVSFTPSAFLIAPDGRIIHRKTGELEINKVRAMLLEMLAQSRQADRRVAFDQSAGRPLRSSMEAARQDKHRPESPAYAWYIPALADLP